MSEVVPGCDCTGQYVVAAALNFMWMDQWEQKLSSSDRISFQSTYHLKICGVAKVSFSYTPLGKNVDSKQFLDKHKILI